MSQFPPDLELTPNVVYGPQPTRPYLLDILRPRARAATPAPAVLFIHGGGWNQFDKYPEASVFLAKAGFVTFSCNYRYSSEAVFPAQLEDVQRALEWIGHNAAELGVDPERIGVWGISAGGHLACLLGGLGLVKAAVGVCPVTDWFDPCWQPVHWELLGGSVAEQPDLARLASPALRVSAQSCPFLLIHGSDDELVALSQSVRMKVSLRAAGVEARLEVIEGGDHFINETHIEKLEGWMLEFFRHHLQNIN